LHQARRGAHATAFAEMIDDVFSYGLRELGIEQRATAALGKLFTTGATAQQPDTITAIDLADHQIALASLPKQVAFGVYTR
jgi:S-adenosylmethionine:diacylglycerol 3-amino-3-carboxypropyl transferase